ncbi:MAG: MBL fold metallo-hydrolase [Anaerolineae bacterium]|jgi:glyoxylase-like metal-dependent hydrolase (beta-lactamase superfamily II)
MPIHHLNCMTFRLGVRSVTHCLLIESADGLVLVDTGLGRKDYEQPSVRMRVFLALNRVPRDPEATAIRQVVGLGYPPEDVRHIVLTHLHLDHCGGLPDFPWAKVHVFESEHQAATRWRQKSLLHWFGYDAAHWAHGPEWVLYGLERETWFGLSCAPVEGIRSARLVLVPLIGHTPGHCGVAVEVDEGWMLHCGDAYVRDVQIDPVNPRSPFPSWAGAFERALFPVAALQKLRALSRERGGEVQLFSAHDPIALARMRAPA